MTKLKTTWDLAPLLTDRSDANIDSIIKQSKEAAARFTKEWGKRQDYLSEPIILKKALDQLEAWEQNWGGTGPLSYYFSMRNALDQADPAIKAQKNKISEVETQLANDFEFFTNRLSKIDKNTQKKMLEFKDLAPYRHFLEKLFANAKYTLTESEEKILNLKNQPACSNWVHMVSEFIGKEERMVLNEKGRKETKSFYECLSLLSHKNKRIRDDSAVAVHEMLAKHADVAEHEINSILLNKKVEDELRGASRPDELRHVSDDMDSTAVDAMILAVSDNFNISQRFYKLKAQLLGVPRLCYHERNVPLGNLDRKYTYQKTVEKVRDTFAGLDIEFASILDNMVQNGQIDVYPAKGKTGGAFCAHSRPKDPVYILLNHTDRLSDVSTLAHEMGHAINDTLMSREQNALNDTSPLSTAEVASTFMEDFVLSTLSREYSENDKLFLIMEKLNDDISTIFRQVACYRFEQELHTTFRDKKYLTKKDIGIIFQKHMKAYMGKAVEQSPGAENWWVYWSHIRRYFYVYTYASGLLISKALQNMVRKNPAQISKIKGFLSAGSSQSPKDIFQQMGLDISDPAFWKTGISEVETLLKQAEKLAFKTK